VTTADLCYNRRNRVSVVTIGLSSALMDDERVRLLGPEAFVLYVQSIKRTSRTGSPILSRTDIIDELLMVHPTGTQEHELDIDGLTARIVDHGLWEERSDGTWAVIDNGLWSLDPDNEPDVLGGDLF
jgi:hypothetical protein